MDEDSRTYLEDNYLNSGGKTNLYSIRASAMFVFHMLAYPEFSALTHLTSLEIRIPKPLIATEILTGNDFKMAD